MLPIDPSPTKEKAVKDLRVAEWVRDSANGVKSFEKVKKVVQASPPIKRKMSFKDENFPTLAKKSKTEHAVTKIERKPSKPMSPRKFYIPNGDEHYKVGVIFS